LLKEAVTEGDRGILFKLKIENVVADIIRTVNTSSEEEVPRQ